MLVFKARRSIVLILLVIVQGIFNHCCVWIGVDSNIHVVATTLIHHSSTGKRIKRYELTLTFLFYNSWTFWTIYSFYLLFACHLSSTYVVCHNFFYMQQLQFLMTSYNNYRFKSVFHIYLAVDLLFTMDSMILKSFLEVFGIWLKAVDTIGNYSK